MHYSHVKSKENPMKTVTIEAIRIDPDLLGVLEARARRARAEAVGNLIVRLIHRLAARLNAPRWDVRWG